MASSARIDELRKKFDENPRRYFAPLANEYRKAGDIDQAVAICREYLPQQPGHMSGHIVYGQALYEAREYQEARTVFETALALDPENLIALRHLGDIALIVGDIDNARTWYGRVLEADPRNEEIQAQLKSLESVSTPASAPTPIFSPSVEEPATTPQSPTAEAPATTLPPAPAQTPASSAPTVVVDRVHVPAIERTVELPLTSAPVEPPSVPPSLSTTPTAEITLDQEPPPAFPNLEEPASTADQGATLDLAVEQTVGFEPTAFPAPPPTMEMDATPAPASDATPIDTFTLEGLETTSMSPVPSASPAEGSVVESQPGPVPDLELASAGPEPLQTSEPAKEAPVMEPVDSGEVAGGEPSGGVEEESSASAELQFLDLGDASQPGAAAVPSDRAQPAPPRIEVAPEAVPPIPTEPAPMAESKPFVTETMAELYEQQGHRDEALRVYRALQEQRPGDDRIRGRIDQLEGKRGPTIREVLTRVAGRRPAPAAAPPPPEAMPQPQEISEPQVIAEPQAISQPEAVAQTEAVSEPAPPPSAHFEATPEVRPEAPPAEPPKTIADRLGALFGNAAVAAADENAAVTLSAAFSSDRRDNGSHAGGSTGGQGGSGIPGAPARPAAKDLSLDAVFGTEMPPPAPASSFSFDQFFSERATSEHPGTARAGTGSSEAGPETRDDVAKFAQWLEGLKQR